MFLKTGASGYKRVLLQNKSNGNEDLTEYMGMTSPSRDLFWFVFMHPGVTTIQSSC